MNRQESIEYWQAQLDRAEAARDYAKAQLGKLTVDEMLMGEGEPVTSWPPYDSEGNYMERETNRTCPQVDGSDIGGRDVRT